MNFVVILLTSILQFIEINGVTSGNNCKFMINQDVIFVQHILKAVSLKKTHGENFIKIQVLNISYN